MLIEIAACGAALALFGRGLYHAGALTGWIAQGLREKPAPPAPPPAPRFDPDAYELELWHATGAWWLDPNRWGDAPTARHQPPARRHVGCPKCGADVARESWTGDWVCVSPSCDYEERIMSGMPERKMPRCPSCGDHEHVTVMSEHGGEATSWYCSFCDGDFTRARRLKRRRGATRFDDLEYPAMLISTGLASPADVREAWQRPPAITKSYQRGDLPPGALPCGCEMSSTETRGPLADGTVFTRCGQCGKWWEPASNDPTHRTLAQGEHVHDRDDMPPHAILAWRRPPADHHGVCPNPECQMPVAKRDGLYYCTDSSCHHAHRGWK